MKPGAEFSDYVYTDDIGIFGNEKSNDEHELPSEKY